MSGHSKWATTKHKKAVVDARRGKMFARLIKNIEVAARVGGGDPAGNPTLYDAIQKAKKSSVPNENIERARKRGGGEEAGGADWQTITYEGYGPSGVAVLVECLTDNRNRAAGEVRVAMTRNGGSMADPGSVAYLFSRKGVVTLEKNGLTEDDVLAAASRSSPSRPIWSPCARRYRMRASTTTRPKPASSRRSWCRWAPTPRARCSNSSMRWRTATTCRTSTPTPTSRMRCWPSWARNRPPELGEE